MAESLEQAAFCRFCLLVGHVNISVRSEAEETQELCGNKISVTPTHGRSDTVIKSLLVKVSEEINQIPVQALTNIPKAVRCEILGPHVKFQLN